MKHKFHQVLDKYMTFLNGYDQPDQIETNLPTVLLKRLSRNCCSPYLVRDKSFTGDIIKYDQQRQQIIVENLPKMHPYYPA